jgi:HAD superfamily hydrolase (TIGR01509 family)
MKPSEKLYQIVERMSGRRGAEILYIDDRPENVAAGAARGWQAVLHESAEGTREALQNLGLLNQS